MTVYLVFSCYIYLKCEIWWKLLSKFSKAIHACMVTSIHGWWHLLKSQCLLWIIFALLLFDQATCLPSHKWLMKKYLAHHIFMNNEQFEQLLFFLNQVLCRSIFYLIIVNLISNWIKSASLKKKIISYIYVYTGTYTDPKFKHWVGRVQTNNFLKLVSPLSHKNFEDK